jgi:molybdopterin synthase sulfur carrier subunit
VIRIVLPAHLRALARFEGELELDIAEPITIAAVIDAIETHYPMLRNTLRNPATGKRRPYVRFYACERDLSHDPLDTLLPPRVRTADDPLLIIGAISGG